MSITTRIVDGVQITTISGAELEQLKADLKASVPPGHCVSCQQPFTCENVRTPAGWAETKLSRLCENCWDEMCAEGA